MGFDFVVEYKPGKANIVADALSRRDADDVEANAFSAPSFDLWREMRLQLQQHHEYQEVLEAVTAGRKGPKWVLTDGFITKERRVFVPASTPIVQLLLERAHTAGREGIQRTLHHLCNDFLIPGDKALVKEFVRDCAVCKQNKTSHLQPSGLLQPLTVPTMIWSDWPWISLKLYLASITRQLSSQWSTDCPRQLTSFRWDIHTLQLLWLGHFLMRWCTPMGFLPPLLVTGTQSLQAPYGRNFFACRVHSLT
jgi:hypothetical protein